METNEVHPDPPESSTNLLCGLSVFLSLLIIFFFVALKCTKNVTEYKITSVISNNATTWNISVQYMLDRYSVPVPTYTSFQVLLFNNNNSNADGNNNSLIAESTELFTPYSLMSSDPITLTNKKKIGGEFSSDQTVIGIWFKYKTIETNSGNSLEDFFCANFTVVPNKNIMGSGGLIASDVPKDC